MPKPWTAQFQISGAVLERDVSVLPEFVSLGTDYYQLRYDGDLDILTTWPILTGTPRTYAIALPI